MLAITDHLRSLRATVPDALLSRRFELTVVLASTGCLVIMTPFAQTPLVRVPAFVPTYECVLAVNDFITAIILFGRFARLRTCSVLAVAAAYLVACFLVIIHILSFPGVFSPSGLLGAGVQTTAWLYVFWHAAFPAILLSYVLIADSKWDRLGSSISTTAAVTAVIIMVGVFSAAITWLTVNSTALLPVIIKGGDYSRMVSIGVSPAILVLTLAALIGILCYCKTSSFNAWLSVVLWFWACDIVLSAIVGSSRFDLGWYGGRLFGLMAASFMLGLLLTEFNQLYAQLAKALGEAKSANEELRAEAKERERVEASLRQSQKMEAIGQLTGGIAHDFNNMLASISGSLELIEMRITQGRTAELERYSKSAMVSVNRAAALTHRLLAFSRRQTLDPKPTFVNGLVAGMEELFCRTVGPAIRLETKLADRLWATLCDPPQLESALLNLVINARDAMPEGGQLVIRSANVTVRSDQPIPAADAPSEPVPSGRYVAISVADTGSGMAPDVMLRAFDPFFTTKPLGQGTGLGLSMIYGFVQQSGGHVRLQSKEGLGTIVTIYLPEHLGAEVEELEIAGSSDLLAGPTNSVVLVVEDEPALRTILVEVLSDRGYTLFEATDGQAGLHILDSEMRIDLLLTDVGLPGGLNGRQLADAARQRRPDLKVLFITGYAEGAAVGNGQMEQGMQVMTKPFAVDALLERVQSMISNQALRPAPLDQRQLSSASLN